MCSLDKWADGVAICCDKEHRGKPGYKRNVIHPARLVIFKVFIRHPDVYIQKGSVMNLYIRGVS